ncbi:MAG: 1-acyl-sn-glycerol-3-phosphate acyltransferase [Bacteriovoracaceae bacterium]|nr:1-acyl-sn-glycerol-3-phosphate acyltransferase [Bacteriovoracaceae bacterium]
MLTKMQKIVLNYPKLKARIENRESPEKERQKAIKNLEEIRAEFSPTTIKTFLRFLDATLPKFYDDINYDDSMVDIKEMMKDKCVVLVPNHQSHADYLVMNYIFYKNYKVPLYVAGGVNLDIFPIGTLFRRSGCFFIRRSFASDVTYKLTLEAYLYYLLKMGRPVEFFFEGGRSRTGKLLPPRYGLYGMLLEAHQALLKERETPLVFVPVSIVHEYVPEQKSLAKELGGAQKKKESTRQLLGLFKLFAYQFGSIHVRLGKPIEVNHQSINIEDEPQEFKKFTQDLAFKCFREVGRSMMVTPTSLLALVLLDEPSGAMVWHDIMVKAEAIINYCNKFSVPYTQNLQADAFEKSLERAMDILIGNKKIDVIGREHHGSLYYSIREESRTEILFFKNTILHHFLIPSIIGDAWINLFSGQINDVKDLKEFFLFQRRQLKHEFYLPTVKQFFYGTLSVVSDAIGRRVGTLEELMSLERQDLYAIASKVGIFNRALTYIMEAYYVGGLALEALNRDYPTGFKIEAFNKKVKEVHEAERKLDRLIRYPESYSIPLTKTALKFYTHGATVENDMGLLKIVKVDDFNENLNRIKKNLNDLLTINIRVVKS